MMELTEKAIKIETLVNGVQAPDSIEHLKDSEKDETSLIHTQDLSNGVHTAVLEEPEEPNVSATEGSGLLHRQEPASGYETPDTEGEEDYRRRVIESKTSGTKLVHRASFKRDKADRHYDKLPWVLGAVSRLLGLRVAPLDVPWHRRMETLSVFMWMSAFLFSGLSAIYLLIYAFLYTQYWWVTLCYLCYYIPDRTICNRGGRRVQWARKWKMWQHFCNFFPVRVVKTTELPADRNYIMCYHPHGVLCAGAFGTFATEGAGWSKIFPKLTPSLLTLELFFWIPLSRELLLLSGAASATRASMDHLLSQEGVGRALCLVVGGVQEGLDSHPGQVVLHLEGRKGFVKMALRHGASLVPMFAFGENDVYNQLPNPEGSWVRLFQNVIHKIFGMAPCFFLGRGIFQYSLGIVPFRKSIYIVIGAPINVEQVRKPSEEQILDLHSRYRTALVDLYDTHKHSYARDPSLPLQFV